jgi:hypothetical protein
VEERKSLREQLEEEGFNPPHAAAIAYLRERHERARTGKIVIKPSDREWFADKMAAKALFYLDHCYEDTAMQDWRVFIHEIQSVSGKHTHQGGLGLFVLDGKGATTFDGRRIEWEKGDLIVLPIKPGGIDHQHFDLDGNAKWLAIAFMPAMNAIAMEWKLTQERQGWTEDDPRLRQGEQFESRPSQVSGDRDG